jgi:hypothetical protein
MATTAEDPITHDQAPPDAPAIDLPVGEQPEEPVTEPVTPGRVSRAGSPRARAPRPVPVAPRRTRVTIRSFGVLSVLKYSILFYVCVMLVIWLALLLIYLVLQAGGVIDTLAEQLGCIVNEPQGTTSACVPVAIDGVELFTVGFFGAMLLAGVLALINMFVAIMYNLISDLVGGINVTLAERRGP